ncbi:hypothetical protein MD484_g5722, partial [Candolleomyces efflorescens]
MQDLLALLMHIIDTRHNLLDDSATPGYTPEPCSTCSGTGIILVLPDTVVNVGEPYSKLLSSVTDISDLKDTASGQVASGSSTAPPAASGSGSSTAASGSDSSTAAAQAPPGLASVAGSQANVVPAAPAIANAAAPAVANAPAPAIANTPAPAIANAPAPAVAQAPAPAVAQAPASAIANASVATTPTVVGSQAVNTPAMVNSLAAAIVSAAAAANAITATTVPVTTNAATAANPTNPPGAAGTTNASTTGNATTTNATGPAAGLGLTFQVPAPSIPIPGLAPVSPNTPVPLPPNAVYAPPGGSRYYTVTRGLRVGVFPGQWSSVSAYVTGVGSAVYERYPTLQEAYNAYVLAHAQGTVRYA